MRASVAMLMTLAILMSSVGVSPSRAAPAAANIVGAGFVVTPADLAFILKQIKIAEAHVAAGPGPLTDPANCQAMIGTGPDQIVNPLLSFGLRTVDGSCNNLQIGQATYGAADQAFPRLTTPVFRDAEDNLFAPPGTPTSYAQTSGMVFDSQPRVISNLIVDQTSTNPAAVQAAGFPLRSQGGNPVVPCATVPGSDPPVDIFPATPVGCVPAFQTLFIENVTTDVGLSPPFNSMFTIFGQFFDHGLDKITNGGNGVVFVPLKDDDPLVAGPDHIFGTIDDLDPGLRFMVLTRGTIMTGPDGFRSAPNTDTPFVDQSQTYTSHSSHQVFTREYVNNINGVPVSTGKFLSSPDGGLPTWAMVKAQAATLLGLQLTDANVGNIPMIAADQYGKFIPGLLRGLPQYVTASGLVEGDTAAPVPVPADAFFINTAFLNDIAHSAAPTFSPPGVLFPDTDLVVGSSLATTVPAGSYDDELLDIHAICGDGRCNENIALQAVHQIFHNEHDRLIDNIKGVLVADTSGVTTLADWQDALGASGWNGERLFQAARFVNEMEYQHLVFEEFARKIQPGINPFQPFAFNQTDVNPAIVAEFAHAVYRFGHSMLTEDIARTNADGSHNDIPLLDGFLNPAAYHDGGTAGVLTSQEAAGAIIMGMSDQAGNEIDEFVTETLRNNLLGLPLDLPTINMTRARSEGIPSLNNVRKQIFAATNDGQLAPYTEWVDWGQALKHPESLVNFIAAYGRHPNITGLDPDGAGPILAGDLKARRMAADQIVNGTVLPGPDGILGPDPSTALDDIPANGGAEHPFIGDDPLTPLFDESLDDTPALPGPDGILGPNPATAADDIFPPTDSADFMFSTGAWVNAPGNVSITGVDDIDLWVGGLAEHTNLFGGLLGSTFNYVFEKQLTDLQNGDRFYYLARTPGMNLRAQLEGNSFAELVMRNTNAHTLKADAFATADCKFEVGNLRSLGYPAAPGSFITGPGSVNDDPASDCDENRLLLNSPTWEIRYRLINSVDPSGINGQAVYNGTDAVDRIFGGDDSDTFWGGLGNDIIEGGDGADVLLGGEGNDIFTDNAGDDVMKGGPGNDAMDGGPGLDLLLGGEGKDFTNGGANTNETFGGPGDDFMIAGQGEDAIFGDSGDDWEEGGDQPDLLIGDSSTLFFDDHNLPGHDILIGQGGDDDYDMEGGDDIGVAGPGVEKVAGASGYDWLIGLGDPQPQNTDLALVIAVEGQPPANEVRDKFNEVEALSGWNHDDILRGDSVIPSQVGGGGFIGCDALDQAGLDRIAGLDDLVPPLSTPLADVLARSFTHHCLLTGDFVWGEGNILLGGAGNDLLEGRGGDDILDGDKYLNVRLSIRNSLGAEIGSTDLMEHAALSGNFGPGTAGMTLQQAVFAGLVDPGNIFAVREILSPAVLGADCTDSFPLNCDSALFSGPQSEYTITFNGDGSVTVAHTGGGGGGGLRANDGTDTLWNIEQLIFCDVPGLLNGTCDVFSAPFPLTPAPVATVVSPTSLGLDFGTVAVAGGPSTPQTITIQNTGTANLSVTSVTPGGTDSADFTVVNGCITVVTPTSTCTIGVTFDPTTIGAKSANISIAHNAAGSPITVSLTGIGGAPIASVAPGSLAFGSVTTGTISPAQSITVSNTGNTNLVVSGITLTGDAGQFTIVSNACGTVTPGGSCNIDVAFAPTTTGGKSAAVVIAHNAAGSPSIVTLGGTGVAAPVAGPTITLPANTNFGTRRVGTVRTQTVTVSNLGPGVLTITSASTSAPFTVTLGTCAAPVAAGRTCKLSVTFAPTAVGAVSRTLTVVSNASNSPTNALVSGVGR